MVKHINDKHIKEHEQFIDDIEEKIEATKKIADDPAISSDAKRTTEQELDALKTQETKLSEILDGLNDKQGIIDDKITIINKYIKEFAANLAAVDDIDKLKKFLANAVVAMAKLRENIDIISDDFNKLTDLEAKLAELKDELRLLKHSVTSSAVPIITTPTDPPVSEREPLKPSETVNRYVHIIDYYNHVLKLMNHEEKIVRKLHEIKRNTNNLIKHIQRSSTQNVIDIATNVERVKQKSYFMWYAAFIDKFMNTFYNNSTDTITRTGLNYNEIRKFSDQCTSESSLVVNLYKEEIEASGTTYDKMLKKYNTTFMTGFFDTIYDNFEYSVSDDAFKYPGTFTFTDEYAGNKFEPTTDTVIHHLFDGDDHCCSKELFGLLFGNGITRTEKIFDKVTMNDDANIWSYKIFTEVQTIGGTERISIYTDDTDASKLKKANVTLANIQHVLQLMSEDAYINMLLPYTKPFVADVDGKAGEDEAYRYMRNNNIIIFNGREDIMNIFFGWLIGIFGKIEGST